MTEKENAGRRSTDRRSLCHYVMSSDVRCQVSRNTCTKDFDVAYRRYSSRRAKARSRCSKCAPAEEAISFSCHASHMYTPCTQDLLTCTSVTEKACTQKCTRGAREDKKMYWLQKHAYQIDVQKPVIRSITRRYIILVFDSIPSFRLECTVACTKMTAE